MPETNVYGHDLMLRASAAIEYPPTPDMLAPVQQRIRASTRAPRANYSPASTRRVFAPLAALAAAAGVMVAAFVIPASRGAVADFFGIEGSRIDILPTAVAPTAFPTPADIDANAVPSTIDEAAVVARFAPALPGGASPSAVYTAAYGEGHGVILRYPEFDLWQVGDGNFEGYFDKGVPSDVVVTDLLVDGVPGTWITNGPHLVVYINASGEAQGEPRTVERNTLIWRTDTALYRLETMLPLEEALDIAESLP